MLSFDKNLGADTHSVGINLIDGTLSSTLKLPRFLDMIGTTVIACLSGPWVAALCGLLANIFLTLVAPGLSALRTLQRFVRSCDRIHNQSRTLQTDLGSRPSLAGLCLGQHGNRFSYHRACPRGRHRS